MKDVKFMQTCDTCGTSYQFGPQRYEGKTIPKYGINVCMTCWQANSDGWAPRLEPKVTAKLNARGAPLPPHNAEGLLPRD